MTTTAPAARLADIPGRGSRPWSVYAWTVVVIGLLISTALAIVVGGVAILLGDRRRRIAHRMLGVGHGFIRRILFRYRCTISGIEDLPSGPFVLAGNHQSLADVVYLYALPLHLKWVVKKEFLSIPLFGISLRVADYPTIDRGDQQSAAALVQRVSENLRSGVTIVSFPEGTRSLTGELGAFQSGTVRMAVANQVPLVPVGIAGTGWLLPSGTAVFARRARVSIHCGAPIPTEGATRKDLRRLNRELRAAIVAARSEAERAGSGNG